MYQDLFPDGDSTDFSKYVFHLTDVDRKGYIDFKEFLLLINVTSYGTAVEKLRWAFRLYDIDGDGKINLQQMTHIVNVSKQHKLDWFSISTKPCDSNVLDEHRPLICCEGLEGLCNWNVC